MEMIYAFVFLGVMGGIYALLYSINKKVPVPKGCEDIRVECDGCKITSCEGHPSNTEEGELKND